MRLLGPHQLHQGALVVSEHVLLPLKGLAKEPQCQPTQKVNPVDGCEFGGHKEGAVITRWHLWGLCWIHVFSV